MRPPIVNKLCACCAPLNFLFMADVSFLLLCRLLRNAVFTGISIDSGDRFSVHLPKGFPVLSFVWYYYDIFLPISPYAIRYGNH